MHMGPCDDGDAPVGVWAVLLSRARPLSDAQLAALLRVSGERVVPDLVLTTAGTWLSRTCVVVVAGRARVGGGYFHHGNACMGNMPAGIHECLFVLVCIHMRVRVYVCIRYVCVTTMQYSTATQHMAGDTYCAV